MANNYQSIENNRIKNAKTIDIHDRIYKFVIRVVNFTKEVRRTPQNFQMKQLQQEGKEITKIVSSIILSTKKGH